jgi:cell division protein FtsW
MIFSIVVEELGFVGAAFIILLFALLIWRGVVIGVNSPTRYGALVSMGVVFQLGVQVLLNILVATDSIPNTGISLPFFSYGGTAILITLAEMGAVLSISRTSRIRRTV